MRLASIYSLWFRLPHPRRPVPQGKEGTLRSFMIMSIKYHEVLAAVRLGVCCGTLSQHMYQLDPSDVFWDPGRSISVRRMSAMD